MRFQFIQKAWKRGRCAVRLALPVDAREIHKVEKLVIGLVRNVHLCEMPKKEFTAEETPSQ